MDGVALPRDELQGFRWLAGKLLHRGPALAAELKQWRQSVEPRWKWRSADDICPEAGDRQLAQRRHYEKHIAGRDVVGFLEFTNQLFSAERLFWRLLMRTTP